MPGWGSSPCPTTDMVSAAHGMGKALGRIRPRARAARHGSRRPLGALGVEVLRAFRITAHLLGVCRMQNGLPHSVAECLQNTPRMQIEDKSTRHHKA